jgi:hypothetical protein
MCSVGVASKQSGGKNFVHFFSDQEGAVLPQCYFCMLNGKLRFIIIIHKIETSHVAQIMSLHS